MPFSLSTPATYSPPLQMAAKYTSPVVSNFVIGLTVCAGIAFAKTSDTRSGAEKKTILVATPSPAQTSRLPLSWSPDRSAESVEPARWRDNGHSYSFPDRLGRWGLMQNTSVSPGAGDALPAP